MFMISKSDHESFSAASGWPVNCVLVVVSDHWLVSSHHLSSSSLHSTQSDRASWIHISSLQPLENESVSGDYSLQTGTLYQCLTEGHVKVYIYSPATILYYSTFLLHILWSSFTMSFVALPVCQNKFSAVIDVILTSQQKTDRESSTEAVAGYLNLILNVPRASPSLLWKCNRLW